MEFNMSDDLTPRRKQIDNLVEVITSTMRLESMEAIRSFQPKPAGRSASRTEEERQWKTAGQEMRRRLADGIEAIIGSHIVRMTVSAPDTGSEFDLLFPGYSVDIDRLEHMSFGEESEMIVAGATVYSDGEVIGKVVMCQNNNIEYRADRIDEDTGVRMKIGRFSSWGGGVAALIAYFEKVPR
jgi:hypothetical protein